MFTIRQGYWLPNDSPDMPPEILPNATKYTQFVGGVAPVHLDWYKTAD